METIHWLCIEFLENLRALGKSNHTIRSYRRQLQAFFDGMNEIYTGYEIEKKFNIYDLWSYDIDLYKEHLLERGLSAASVNNALSVIKSFCDWMVEEKYYKSNPCDGVDRVDSKSTLPPRLTKNSIYRLSQHILNESKDRDKVIIFTLLKTGITASELTSLQHKDVVIDGDKGFIIIYGKSPRKLPLDKTLIKVLGDFMLDNPDGTWLFGSERRDQLTVVGLYQVCRGIGNEVGIPHLNPQLLRHTYCYGLIDAGISLYKVADLMGIKLLNLQKYFRGKGTPIEIAYEKIFK